MNARLADERGFVLASLIRMIVVLVVLGIVAVEGASIFFTHLTLQDGAEYAAIVGADQLDETGSPEAAREAAVVALAEREDEAKLAAFQILSDGGVRITARKQATTILVHRIGPIEDWARVEVTVTGRPVATDV